MFALLPPQVSVLQVVSKVLPVPEIAGRAQTATKRLWLRQEELFWYSVLFWLLVLD